MKWEKRGKLLDKDTWNISWFRKNVMCPVPYLLNKDILRIYVALCDGDNRGRIGYIDVNPENPNEIFGYSPVPILDLGARGCFDENGVLPSSLIEINEKLYLFYSAYQRQVNIPYTSLSGIACSDDGGNHFYRLSSVPILDRKDGEKFIRSSIYVVEKNDSFDIYYAGGDQWILRDDKINPSYSIKHMHSDSIFEWSGAGDTVFELQPGEYGMTDAQLIEQDNRWIMLFSVRSWKKGYRLAYAESFDGKHWIRKDNEIGIDVSGGGWDNEMICFGRIIAYKDKTYLFYCGNHYGVGGLGWAIRTE